MGIYYGTRPTVIDNIVTSGLLGLWDALNTTSYPGSGSTWNDLSGNNYAASLVNSPTFNNDGTGSFTLNGTSQYMTMNTAYYPFPRYTSPVTLSIWFKTSSTAASLSLFGCGNNITGGARINMWISSQTMGCETQNDYIGTDVGTFSLNTWYNLAVVNVGNITTSQLKLYVNGVDRTATYGGTNNYSINMAPTGAASDCVIGTIPGYNLAYFFPGSIAIPMVYNRALTAGEISQNFTATRARFGI